MSSFQTHRIFNYLLFIIGCLILNYIDLFNIYVMIVFGIGFILGTEFVTPDLDGESTPSQRLGILWLPYRIIRKHRGVSHNYLLGFIERIVYLFVLISAIILLIKRDVYISFIKFIIDPAIMAVLFVMIVGIAIANGLHIFLDGVTSKIHAQ
jgi:uncharacterized metal-binding protein